MDKQKVKELHHFIDIVKADPSLLNSPELEFFKQFIESLGGRVPASPPAATEPAPVAPTEPELDDPERWEPESDAMLAMPPAGKESLSDAEQDKCNELKSKAQDEIEAGNDKAALASLTEAVSLGAVTAMLMTKRAGLLLKLRRPLAAIKDCDFALTLNPDNAKAFRIRGTAFRHLHRWEEAHSDLANSQRIDFDENTEDVKRFVDQQYKKIKKAQPQPQAKRAPAPSTVEETEDSGFGGFPGIGGMGGMGGIPASLFGDLMKDPELMAAMANPKVMGALQAMMSNPAAFMQYQNDPEVGPVLMKLMSKMGGAM